MEASPEWLMPWLQTPSHDKTCNQHVHQYFTIYCGACMGEPFCKACWENEYSKEHEGHRPILQVCKASRRAAIEVKEIREYFDISYIQQYRINKKDIVFLNSSMNGVGEGEPTINIKCRICAKRLKELQYCFCSIACKKKSMELDMQAKESSDTQSMHKKSRKGTPQRAPLK